MRRSSRISALLLAAAFSVTSSTAYAESTYQPLQPESRGWVIVALSVAAGAVLTGASLTVRCSHADECSRWVSLGIWGGIGIASAGSVVGLAVVTRDAREARLRLSVSVERSSSGTSMPVAVLVGRF